jgi:hypothetical protein
VKQPDAANIVAAIRALGLRANVRREKTYPDPTARGRYDYYVEIHHNHAPFPNRPILTSFGDLATNWREAIVCCLDTRAANATLRHLDARKPGEPSK